MKIDANFVEQLRFRKEFYVFFQPEPRCRIADNPPAMPLEKLLRNVSLRLPKPDLLP